MPDDPSSLCAASAPRDPSGRDVNFIAREPPELQGLDDARAYRDHALLFDGSSADCREHDVLRLRFDGGDAAALPEQDPDRFQHDLEELLVGIVRQVVHEREQDQLGWPLVQPLVEADHARLAVGTELDPHVKEHFSIPLVADDGRIVSLRQTYYINYLQYFKRNGWALFCGLDSRMDLICSWLAEQ